MIVQTLIVFADSTTHEGANADIDTDGSQSCAVWFKVFDKLMDDKVTNGVKFFLILTSLRHDSIETKIEIALNSNSTRKELLEEYGLDAQTIYLFMDYFMSGFPSNIDDVKLEYNPGDNIYSDLYHESDFNYSKYMKRFHNYLNELFRALPYQMQDVISKYDRKKAGEIVVMQGLLNIIISDYIAFETYNTETGKSESESLHLRPEIRQELIDELTSVANDYPENYEGEKFVDNSEIEEFIDVLVGFADVMLYSVELNLKENSLMRYATDLAGQTNLLVRTPFTPSVTVELIEVTLRMNTEFIELDSSDPLTDGYINSFQLTGNVGGVSNDVVYTIDDPSIANVDENGFVTLSDSKQGVATITATVEGYNVFKEITVQVSEQSPKGFISFYGSYISGYPDGSFRSDGTITRAEIATMMIRVLRLNVNDINQEYRKSYFEEGSFSDVNSDNWAFIYIELAKQNGIMKGYKDKTFKPDQPVSRAEMAVIISNAFKLFDVNQPDYARHFIKDVRVDHWAFNAINIVYNAGIVTGYDDGTFKPNDLIKRGEVVVMINKLINRSGLESQIPTFFDIAKDHWAFKAIEAATQLQIITD